VADRGGGASRSTDPAAGTSSATDVSLREYLGAAIDESRRECRDNIAHLEKHFDEVTTHAEESLDEFRRDVSRRFDGVNEFRGALEDLSQRMATKDNLSRVEEKFEANIGAQAARVTVLERRIDLREGEQVGSKVTMGNLIAAASVFAAVIGALFVLVNYLSGQ
jgi:hypothetical protein